MKRSLQITGFLFAALLVACGSTYTLSEKNAGKLVDYSSAKPDTGLQHMIDPYSRVYQNTMTETIGYLADDMEKGYPEGKLGNWMADIFLDLVMSRDPQFTANNTFALFNNGGLRVSLQKGVVTRGRLFELMPFENMLVAVKLKGRYLVHELAAYLLAKKGQPLSHNMRVQFKGNQLVSMQINGVPVDTTKEYTVLTSDYLSNGGDNMTFFQNGTLVQTGITIKLRDGLIDHFAQHSSEQKPLTAPALGRITIE